MGYDRPAGAPVLGAPLYVQGPEGPWEEAAERLDDTGRAVVCTAWGQWLTAVLLDPALRPLLGDDWPRFRGTPAAAGRMRFAVSRFLVRYAAATALQVPADALELGYGPAGRPVVLGPGAGVEVSLAHAGELVAVGVSRAGAVGVDVQPADREVHAGMLLRGRVCTREEAALLGTLPEGERRARLLRLWALKEACAEALGHRERPAGAAVGFGFGFGFDRAGRVTLTGSAGTAPAGAGRWSVAAHLVQDRYLVAQAHRSRS